ncbi:ribosomal protein S18-alanine N-acetyltransferase [Lysobacter silvisoli]|nr:ribosomal protein S18-alanine N-acetyltransferase [Lysobacter silvisoli]
MREADLEAVHAIEIRAYEFPWTLGIFRDCLRADYPSWVLYRGECILGYFLMSLAAGEAHVLNVCVTPDEQGHGHGRRLLLALLQIARGRGAERVFLEVRPSNPNAIALYHAEGFNEIGRRPRYYPARDGREDALVMAMELLPPEAP